MMATTTCLCDGTGWYWLRGALVECPSPEHPDMEPAPADVLDRTVTRTMAEVNALAAPKGYRNALIICIPIWVLILAVIGQAVWR